jgi:hypothetical protein
MIHDHIVDQIHNKQLIGDNTLYVIGVISNPVRYHSRYRLFREWKKRMEETPCVKVVTCELAFGHRKHEVTDPMNPFDLQLRTNQELWHKENLINLATRALPKHWKYVAWIDCDISFPDKGWAQETLHQLQHYDLVQPWRDCVDLGVNGNILQHFQSFAYIHSLGVRKQTHPSQPYKYAHSGFAWACTRKFWENVKGLMERCIVGSADHHMAWASINQVEHSVHGKMPDSFKRYAKEWQRDAFRVTQGNLGYVKTRIEHHFHGPKSKRYYRERWQMFIDHQFDPYTDLSYDEQGVLRLNGKPALEEEIRKYFRSRHEDSIEEN